MKKIILLLIVMIMFFISAISVNAENGDEIYQKYKSLAGTSLNVYNWGEYISDGGDDSMDVNAEFEKLTGIKVNYTTYDNNEDMYTKLKSGGAGYDIIVPSDYMIARLIKEDMLEKIDFSNIPNYSNIMDKYKGLYFDPTDEYSVPYNVGMVGIIYNTKVVKGSPDSWSLMWDKDYTDQILQFNNPRDGFATAQFYLGIDVNTTDEMEWRKAYNLLADQKSVVQSYVADEIFNKMEAGDAAIGAYYAGDYLIMLENNPDLAFYYPKEGTNIFVDSICIPKSAQNKTAAELYINFLLSGDVALANAEYIGYATPNKLVLENDEYIYKDEEILYPENQDEMITTYYENLPNDILSLMTDLWSKLKIEGNDSRVIYYKLGGAAAVAVVAGVFSFVKKKKREKLYDV